MSFYLKKEEQISGILPKKKKNEDIKWYYFVLKERRIKNRKSLFT